MNHLNAFQSARLKLTFWYIVISFFLLTIFSLSAIGAENKAFDRIQTALENRTNITKRPQLTFLLDRRITEFDQAFKERLFLFDIILLVIASGASYLLSGLTLKPIQAMITKQQEFAADASHELRTPLTTIKMEIEALERTEKNIPEKYHSLFVSINEEVSRMKDIVDGLLVLVRSDSYDQKKTWKVFDLSKLASESLRQMEPLAKEKDIHLLGDLTNKIHMYGSEEKVKQVILILLDNAIKYTPEKGKVTLATTRQKSDAILAVSDTGIGIPEKDKEAIFDRFYRVQTGKTHEQKGSGLGLAIAKKIIDSLNGKISVDSKQGEGTTFIVALPSNS